LKGCSQKKAFEHEGQARREAHKAGAKRVYICEFCGLWHMTNAEQKQSKGGDDQWEQGQQENGE
jgi:hypothetical protein